jgi:hypothetical protein
VLDLTCLLCRDPPNRQLLPNAQELYKNNNDQSDQDRIHNMRYHLRFLVALRLSYPSWRDTGLYHSSILLSNRPKERQGSETSGYGF